MRLVLALGYRSLRELEDSLGSDELTRWVAFAAEYDLPDPYFLAGRVCTAVLRAAGASEAQPADFVPFYRTPARAMGAGEIRSAFAQLRESARAGQPGRRDS